MKQRTITYRIWRSSHDWVEIQTNYWLADALKKSGITEPFKVQFWSVNHWRKVCDLAVRTAVKHAFNQE